MSTMKTSRRFRSEEWMVSIGSLCDSVIVSGARQQHLYRLCMAEVGASIPSTPRSMKMGSASVVQVA